jgi:cytochrome c-type biogenesis protein CcmH/NrfG
MSELTRCPDCGHPNPPERTDCEACNFPLRGPAAAAPAGESPPEHEPQITIPRPIHRARARRPPPSNTPLTLWLVFGVIAAAAVVYIALQANLKRATPPVEGSNASQQQAADEFRAAIAQDSTNVDAQIGLANILFDTANWPEAIQHYQIAIRRDSTHVHAIVDLGVCYYNMGNTEDAERLFQLALVRDPHQPIALFNLGIVNERRGDLDKALSFMHRALESSPPEEMRKPIMDAMERVQKATGKKPGPIPDGR